MTQQGATDLIVRMIAIELETTEDQVRTAGSLRNDLGMDSIAAANVLFSLEQELGVELDLDEVEGLDSVVDIAGLVVHSQVLEA